MKIIITGPNGFIARNIILKIKKKNNITLLSHKKLSFSFLKKLKTVKFDLSKNLIPELTCDVLIHAAAITPQKKHSSKEYNNTNFKSLKQIIKKIKINKRIIFFSTSDIYKNQKKNFNLKENLDINIKKISPYAKSKYKCENYLKKLDFNQHPFEKIVLRLPGIIGGDNHDNFISNLVNNILLKKKLSYFGGKNLFNNTYHIDSLVKVIIKLVKKGTNKNFEIINIGSNKPITINKVIQLLNGKIVKNNPSPSKKNMFTINVDKLNKYYGLKLNTNYFIKKYLKEKLLKKNLTKKIK